MPPLLRTTSLGRKREQPYRGFPCFSDAALWAVVMSYGVTDSDFGLDEQ
jgi:hypothetical protein